MEKKGFNPSTISSVNDFGGFDELRHENLGLEEFTSGHIKNLFDK